MLGNIVKKVFGSKNDRELKRMGKTVAKINALEESISPLSDEELQAKTAEFKQRLEGVKPSMRSCPKLLQLFEKLASE